MEALPGIIAIAPLAAIVSRGRGALDGRRSGELEGELDETLRKTR